MLLSTAAWKLSPVYDIAPVATGPAVDWVAVAKEEETIFPLTTVSVRVVVKGMEDPLGVIVLVTVRTVVVEVIVVVVVRSAATRPRKLNSRYRHATCEARVSKVK